MKAIGSLALVCSLWAAPLQAATVFQFESRDLDPSNPVIERVRISAEAPFLKMDLDLGEDDLPETTMIFNDKAGTIVIVDHADRNYMVMDRETLAGFGEQVSDAMSEMQKQMESAMANMDPKQREMMEKMVKDRMPKMTPAPPRSKAELRKTSRREHVGDYTCLVYDVSRDGEKIREHCVSPWDKVGIPAETIDLFKHMGEFFEETFGEMARSIPGGSPEIDNPFAELEEMDAFPVLTREFEDGEPESENVLLGVTRQALDPDAFEPPSGYALREMDVPRMPG